MGDWVLGIGERLKARKNFLSQKYGLFEPYKNNRVVFNTGKITEKTTEKILCIIKNNPRVTYRELAESLAMTEDGIYWSVKQLRKQGLLCRIGGRKEGYWQVVTQ